MQLCVDYSSGQMQLSELELSGESHHKSNLKEDKNQSCTAGKVNLRMMKVLIA